MSEKPLNEESTPLEALLASFEPTPLEFDRDRVMFQAGRASAAATGDRPRRLAVAWGWAGAFGGMTAVAASLLVLLLRQPTRDLSDGKPPERRPPDLRQEDSYGSPRPPIFDVGRGAGIAYAAPSRGERLPAGAKYDALLERMLVDEFEAWERPDPASTRQPVAGPVTCGEWMEMLSRELDSTRPLDEWNVFSHQRGAES